MDTSCLLVPRDHIGRRPSNHVIKRPTRLSPGSQECLSQTAGVPRRHHIVSAGYQRHFAHRERIRLIWKSDGGTKVVSVRDAFVESGFNSFRTGEADDDSLEDEWAKREDLALRDVRRLLAGSRDEDTDKAVKVLAVIHWARSYAIRLVHDRVVAEVTEGAARAFPLSEPLLRRYREQYGTVPPDGYIAAIVRERMAELVRTNLEFVERMASFYNQAMDHFAPHHVQLVSVAQRTRFGLLTGDVPVVLRGQDLRVGPHSGLALKDATTLYMPLSRWTAMALTTKPEGDGLASPLGVQQLNNMMWQSCIRFVAAHPHEDWQRALGTKRFTAKGSGYEFPPIS